MDPSYPSEYLSHMLRNVGPGIDLTQSSLAGALRSFNGLGVRARGEAGVRRRRPQDRACKRGESSQRLRTSKPGLRHPYLGFNRAAEARGDRAPQCSGAHRLGFEGLHRARAGWGARRHVDMLRPVHPGTFRAAEAWAARWSWPRTPWRSAGLRRHARSGQFGPFPR